MQLLQSGTSSKKDIFDFVDSIIGSGKSGVDSSDLTPSSSVPGTPALGQPSALPIQAQTSAVPLPGSGRLSRQSDFQDRTSIGGGSTLVGSSNAGTDHVIER